MTTMTINEAPEVIRKLSNVIRQHGTCAPMALDMVADVIQDHLSKVAHVPDAKRNHDYQCNEDDHPDAYCCGHMDGWNACRQAMLSQRGEVEGG